MKNNILIIIFIFKFQCKASAEVVSHTWCFLDNCTIGSIYKVPDEQVIKKYNKPIRQKNAIFTTQYPNNQYTIISESYDSHSAKTACALIHEKQKQKFFLSFATLNWGTIHWLYIEKELQFDVDSNFLIACSKKCVVIINISKKLIDFCVFNSVDNQDQNHSISISFPNFSNKLNLLQNSKNTDNKVSFLLQDLATNKNFEITFTKQIPSNKNKIKTETPKKEQKKPF